MTDPTPDLAELWRRLAVLEPAPLRDTPLSELAAEFFAENWRAVQPLLAAAPRLRLVPCTPALRAFEFTLDLPFLRQAQPGEPVQVAAPPIRGTLAYRPDPFAIDGERPAVCVLVDRAHGLLHPNYSRAFGILCLGALPGGPLPLQPLLEHLYAILTYANLSTLDVADPDAAAWFAATPEALAGLPPAAPLWGRGAA
jgi:hypothetical protein